MTSCQGKRQGVCLYSEWRHLEKGGWKTEARTAYKWLRLSGRLVTDIIKTHVLFHVRVFCTWDSLPPNRNWRQVGVNWNFFKKKGMSTMKMKVKNKEKTDKWLLPLNLTSCISAAISVVVMDVNWRTRK